MATYLEKIERRKKIRTFLQIMLCIIVVGIGGICEYTTINETTSVCKKLITEQHINEGYTTYTYLVTTEDGIFEITNKGLFSSPDFGKIEEGEKYTFKTRGVSFPILGVYPYIITVKVYKEDENKSIY